jgi:hypothetical protein
MALDVTAMAAILAALFPVAQSGAALKAQYPADTASPNQMAIVLQTVYTTIGDAARWAWSRQRAGQFATMLPINWPSR